METKKYFVQFLLIREIEVEELDSIQAVERARTTLRPQDQDCIVYERVCEEDGEIAADWQTHIHVDYDVLQHNLGLVHGDMISSNR